MQCQCIRGEISIERCIPPIQLSILGIPYGQFKTEWSIRLATCLQKENAEIINNKLLSIVGKKTGVNQVHQPISRCFSFRNT